MKVMVTGAKGQLGFDVAKELKKRNMEVLSVDIDDMDITDEEAVNNIIGHEKPDAVVHCAAYTAVDDAEASEELCRKINFCGTENIAKACKALGAKMVYISTDYVFNGSGEKPWEPSDKKEPLNVYGMTKYEGEKAVQKHLSKYFIIRISWVFGINGKNFVKTMLRLSETHNEIKVVNDQIGSPTYTPDLAVLIADMLQTEKYGIYHASNEGFCSWYEFAEEIFKQSGIRTKINLIPVSTNDYKTKAKRPFNSRMSKVCLDEAGFKRLPEWKDALFRFLNEWKEEV